MNEQIKQLSRAEHAAWQLVCEKLLRCGAVTETDLRASENDQTASGRILLNVIRGWGAARADLMVAAAKPARVRCSK
jgi:hypothetical protein